MIKGKAHAKGYVEFVVKDKDGNIVCRGRSETTATIIKKKNGGDNG